MKHTMGTKFLRIFQLKSLDTRNYFSVYQAILVMKVNKYSQQQIEMQNMICQVDLKGKYVNMHKYSNSLQNLRTFVQEFWPWYNLFLKLLLLRTEAARSSQLIFDCFLPIIQILKKFHIPCQFVLAMSASHPEICDTYMAILRLLVSRRYGSQYFKVCWVLQLWLVKWL